ncbi:MAG: efflux RND transporter permease subunit [Deltaproteobacteria bacterium]
MLAKFFIDRPIFAWVVSIVITLMGGVAAFMLPIAQYPEIVPPTVQVTASYPGANASVVADSVAAPIEQQVNGVEHMLYMSSQCTNDGAYTLTATFELGTDLNMAQVLVQNRVALATPQLPPQVQVLGVSVKKKSPSILLVVNLISPDGRFDDLYLSNYATIQIKDELLRISGVGDITYQGQRDYSMRVWLDPEKMAALNLATSDVIQAVQNQNIQAAVGQIGQQPMPPGQLFQLTMSTLGRLEDVNQFQDIVIKTGEQNRESGQLSKPVVRLRDVARVELGAQQYDQVCRLDGQPSVGLAVFQLPGSNALDVAERIKKKMEELRQRFPPGLEYRIIYDTTPFVEQSIEEVFKTLYEAVILVAIVVLFFLQDWKAMILPMIDVPVSLIGTFAVMAAMGFTLNNLTLFGLVLAIGIVVDDAIVVLEAVEHHISEGLDPRSATIKAMGEITGPIIAITLVLISVFLPAAFVTGITGQFYRQFALTIAASMVISAVNAMTLTPARAVAIFKTEGEGGHMIREALPWWIFAVIGGAVTYNWLPQFVPQFADLPHEGPLKWLPAAVAFAPGAIVGGAAGWFLIRPVNAFLGFIFRHFNRLFDRITRAYGWTVGRMLRVSAIVIVAYGGLLFLTVRTMRSAPTGFIPVQDQGFLLVNAQLPDSWSVQETQKVMATVDKIALGDPDDRTRFPGIPGIAHTLSISGQSLLLSANGSNFGSAYMVLAPFEERREHEHYDAVIAQKLREECGREIPDAVVTVFRAPPIMGLGTAGGFKLQLEQRGFVDLQGLQTDADNLIQAANKDPRLVGLFTVYRANTPQVYLDIDRTKCESLDVEVQDAFNTLQVYMGGYFVNLFNKFGRTWQVNILADESFRAQPEEIRNLKVRNKRGEMVPLGTLTDAQDAGGPVMVTRYNMYAAAPVNGNTAPGVSSGDAIGIMADLAKEQEVSFEWTEITYMQILAGSTAAYVFALGSLLVFLILAAKYESWALPLSVILVVPMCLLCAVVGMLIAHMPVDVFVQVGFLVLVGLAAKNAILIVEFAKQLQDGGETCYDATVAACRLRLRPIIMTAFAFILGVVPLVVSEGAGAEMRASLGTAVFSGMLGVTAFGIFLTPVFYYVVYRPKKAPTRPVETHANKPAEPVRQAT